MQRNVRQLTFMLSLVFLFNEVSMGLHFIFFHHQAHSRAHDRMTVNPTEPEAVCPYKNTLQIPAEPFSIPYFKLFLLLIKSACRTMNQEIVICKFLRGYQLRAPPGLAAFQSFT